MSLETTYLGLPLKTPLVPSASPLSGSLDNLLRMEDAGASAVVLPTLFQEQITGRFNDPDWSLAHGIEPYSEVLSYFPNKEHFLADPDAHLKRVRDARAALSIPVIASLGGFEPGDWTDFAWKLADAGASALELSIYNVPTDPAITADAIEGSHAQLVSDVRLQISIPLVVKLTPFFTNFHRVASRMVESGADGLVLFNRLFPADIELEGLSFTHPITLTDSEDSRLPLHWIAILRKRLSVSLAASGGVHSGIDALKLIIAGADVTMICSAMMRRIDVIRSIETEMNAWMTGHGYTSLNQIKGIRSCERLLDPSAFERSNYLWSAAALSESVKR
jgi:dihydroorotate dehydrogenase (fumarate)